MPAQRMLHCIGYASGVAAADPSCCMGPLMLQAAFFAAPATCRLEWREMLYPPPSEHGLAAVAAVADINRRLAKYSAEYTANGDLFLILGGDHTSAIGTWGGAAHALAAKGGLGLIWIDAGMDSHTPQTSISQNLHEMALAILLGQGPTELVQLVDSKPALLPEQLCLVGVRAFEPIEAELLKRLGVRIFFMEEVKQRGLAAVMQDAVRWVNQGTGGYGISLDIRAIDPVDAPATSLVVADGLSGEQLVAAFKQLQGDARLLGLEIAEFDPRFDRNLKTEKLIQQLVEKIFAK